MASRKYLDTLNNLLKEWFENRSQLQNYDYEMLKRLATISLKNTTTKDNTPTRLKITKTKV